MQVRVGCEFVYDVSHPTPAVWQVRARTDGLHRLLREAWETEPSMGIESYRDSFGNTCDRLMLPEGTARVRYDATFEVPPKPDPSAPDAAWVPVEDLPPETLLFLLPSRFCHPEHLRDRAWDLFGGLAPGWAQVQAICDWVHTHLSFAYGAITSEDTSTDVLERGSGVCRDYAHVGVTFCRALNIPARYAFGYLPDIGVAPPGLAMDFYAWFEAYLGGRWWTFDPRNNQRRVGRILIGRGRDAVDVAMVTAYGLVELKTMDVWADPVPHTTGRPTAPEGSP